MTKLSIIVSFIFSLTISSICFAQEIPLVNNYDQFISANRTEDIEFFQAVNVIRNELLSQQDETKQLLYTAQQLLMRDSVNEFATVMNKVADKLSCEQLSCQREVVAYDHLLKVASRKAYHR
jgi:hypothetical protein